MCLTSIVDFGTVGGRIVDAATDAARRALREPSVFMFAIPSLGASFRTSFKISVAGFTAVSTLLSIGFSPEFNDNLTCVPAGFPHNMNVSQY